MKNAVGQGLYRFYDADGRLVYIGASMSLSDRLVDHSRSERWSLVASITLEHHPHLDYGELLDLERAAIGEERPLWNLSLPAGADRPVAPLVSLDEVATRIGRSPASVRTSVCTHRTIPCVRMGATLMISEADVGRLIRLSDSYPIQDQQLPGNP